LIPRIKDLIIDTFNAAKTQLNPSKRNNCFELFGYDFLIDEDFRTWLLEVNSNAYIGVPNNYIKKLLPEMLDDMFSIVLDPVFPPKIPQNTRKNRYEMIYSDKWAKCANPVNQRNSFKHSLYPVEALK
jgi:hypothetical protein